MILLNRLHHRVIIGQILNFLVDKFADLVLSVKIYKAILLTQLLSVFIRERMEGVFHLVPNLEDYFISLLAQCIYFFSEFKCLL